MKLTSLSLSGLLVVAAGCSSKSGSTEYNSDMDNITADGGATGGASTGATGSTGGGQNTTGGGSTGSTNSGNCEEKVVRTEPVSPDILIVLDRSGSMNPDSNPDGTDRWTGSKNAVIASTAKFDDQIQFGLMTFPFVGDDPCAGMTGTQLIFCQFQNAASMDTCAPGEVNVPVGLKTAAEIMTVLGPMNAGGATPTAPSLANAADAIGSGIAGPDAVVKPKVVLLITDGDPNCGGGSGGGGGSVDSQARQDTINNIMTLSDNGVRTYVVGFQTAGSDFAANLDMMAAAGATGATAHTSVASEAELNTVLESLIGKAVSCTFSLDKEPPNATFVLVTLDGKQLNLDKPDGWKLGADGRTVEVLGQACATLQSGAGQHTLGVEVKCDVVPVI